MSGGSVGANVVYVGEFGTGTFTQSGGSIGAYGTGGSNKAIGIYVSGDTNPGNTNPFYSGHNGNGTFNLGGTNGSSSTALIVGGVEYVGMYTAGIFNQSGGTNAIIGGGSVGQGAGPYEYDNYDGALVLGFYHAGTPGGGGNPGGVGTYNLSGGLLTGGPNPVGGMYGTQGGNEFLGVSGTGIFNQTGGTNNCSALDVGSVNDASMFMTGGWPNGGGRGIYTLSGGLLISTNVSVGSEGYINNGVIPVFAGTFTQTGGTSKTQDLQLGDIYNGTDCKATYNLCGGLLQTPAIDAGAPTRRRTSPSSSLAGRSRRFPAVTEATIPPLSPSAPPRATSRRSMPTA